MNNYVDDIKTLVDLYLTNDLVRGRKIKLFLIYECTNGTIREIEIKNDFNNLLFVKHVNYDFVKDMKVKKWERINGKDFDTVKIWSYTRKDLIKN